MSPAELSDGNGQALAGDCADALRLELDCPQQEFTSAQRATLRALDDALATDSAAETIRAAAKACVALGIVFWRIS